MQDSRYQLSIRITSLLIVQIWGTVKNSASIGRPLRGAGDVRPSSGSRCLWCKLEQTGEGTSRAPHARNPGIRMECFPGHTASLSIHCDPWGSWRRSSVFLPRISGWGYTHSGGPTYSRWKCLLDVPGLLGWGQVGSGTLLWSCIMPNSLCKTSSLCPFLPWSSRGHRGTDVSLL